MEISLTSDWDNGKEVSVSSFLERYQGTNDTGVKSFTHGMDSFYKKSLELCLW